MILSPQRRRPRRELVFSPLAYLKLQYLCHAGPTEVGAFAISSTQQPLYIEELHTIPQITSAGTVEFDDSAVADYFDRCVDQGLQPTQFARLWLHTHPGSCPRPSGTDEETFKRVFGTTDWAVMAILSRTSNHYARLRINAGPGATCLLRWRVDWAAWPEQLQGTSLACLEEAWQEEYRQNVHPILPRLHPTFSDIGWNSQMLEELDHWRYLATRGEEHDVLS